MGSLLNLDEDGINRALMEGLKEGFKAEMKFVLMGVAEKEVDAVVEELSKRVEARAENFLSFEDRSRHIKLEWFLKKEA